MKVDNGLGRSGWQSPTQERVVPERVQGVMERTVVWLQDLRANIPVGARRRVVPYESNFTPALGRVWGLGEGLFQKKSCETDGEPLSLPELVSHHAFQRMQLFYYTCLAYWKEGCDVQRGATSLQYGVRQCREGSAAHCALLPCLVDNSLEVLKSHMMRQGMDSWSLSRLRRLGLPIAEKVKQKGKLRPSQVDALFNGVQVDSLISPHCHLHHVLNMTTELPSIVNECDHVIEESLREEALIKVNSCSLHETHPYQALTLFSKTMTDFLDKTIAQTRLVIQDLEELATLAGRIDDLERRAKNGERCLNALQAALATLWELKHKLLDYKRYSLKKGIAALFKGRTALVAAMRQGDRKKARSLLEATSNELSPLVDQCLVWQRQALHVFEWQREASVAPSYSLLSGKRNWTGERIGFSPQELLGQKEALLRRSYDVRYTRSDPGPAL